MELTILGSSATFPTPKRACSSYLVTEQNLSLLLDLGPGAFSNLTVYVRPEALDVLVITHFHQDHFLDIYPLYYYLRYESPRDKPLPVYAPSGSLERLGHLLGANGEERLSEIFDFSDIEEGSEKIGELALGFGKVKHLEPTFGVWIESENRKLAYSSDSGYTEKLSLLAANSALFVCEATLIEPIPGLDHMTAEEAGRVAGEAGVQRLLITHVWPSIDPESSRLIAEEYFVGEVIIAEDGEKMVV